MRPPEQLQPYDSFDPYAALSRLPAAGIIKGPMFNETLRKKAEEQFGRPVVKWVQDLTELTDAAHYAPALLKNFNDTRAAFMKGVHLAVAAYETTTVGMNVSPRLDFDYVRKIVPEIDKASLVAGNDMPPLSIGSESMTNLMQESYNKFASQKTELNEYAKEANLKQDGCIAFGYAYTFVIDTVHRVVQAETDASFDKIMLDAGMDDSSWQAILRLGEE